MEERMLEVLETILWGMMFFSIFYYITIVMYAGISLNFSIFWLILSIGNFVLGVLINFLDKRNFPFIHMIEGVLFFLIIVFFVFYVIMYSFLRKKGSEVPIDYIPFMIVLGARVKGKIPTRALKRRVNKAYEYLARNENTIAILSGGKGEGEFISEALCMQKLLIEKKIPENRLILEDKSRTTGENIKFSKRWIENKKEPVLIVSSDFHVWRGMVMAAENGFSRVYGLGAKSEPLLILHYYTREIFAWIKYWIS